MKICVLGLDGATPDIVFHDERLVNIRRLMDVGVYGIVQAGGESATLRVWMSMGTSQAPEALDPKAPAIWNLLADHQNRSALLGLTSDIPPYEIDGVSFASFPATASPSDLTACDSESVVPTAAHTLSEQVLSASRTRWQTARTLFPQQRWAYFQIVDVGMETLGVDLPSPEAISDYYLWLDEQVGSILELLDDDTLLLIVSPRAIKGSSSNPQASQPGDGFFVLVAPNCPLTGEYHGASLLDLAPTMLDLVGREIPPTMQGKSLVAEVQKKNPDETTAVDEESLIRDRLAGLGYI
ncbi:MAG TPA: hypothetical protein VFA68_16910 [Terriglobales bacterium]|nr:hypothetical protein [Terriglobales bacterium]